MKRENQTRIDSELLEMNLGELLDLWDEPMDASQRQELFRALEARGYRTRSLPEPPPEPSGTPQIVPSPTATSQQADLASEDPRLPMPPAYLWHVLLFLRPGIFFRTFGRQPSQALVFTAVWFVGLAHILDRDDLDQVQGIRNWAQYWGQAMGRGLVASWIWYYFTGWWTNVRVGLSGGRKNALLGRHVNLFSTIPWAVTVVGLYLVASRAHETPQDLTWDDEWALGYGVVVIGTLWSIMAKWRGILALFKVRRLAAAFWFLVLPLGFYATLGGLAITGSPVLARLSALEANREPLRLEQYADLHLFFQYDSRWSLTRGEDNFIELDHQEGFADAHVVIEYWQDPSEWGRNDMSEMVADSVFGLETSGYTVHHGPTFEQWGQYSGLGQSFETEEDGKKIEIKTFVTQAKGYGLKVMEFLGPLDCGASDRGLASLRRTLELK